MLAELSVKRWQLTLIMFLALLALGANALNTIPKAEDPTFPLARFAIIAVLPGAMLRSELSTSTIAVYDTTDPAGAAAVVVDVVVDVVAVVDVPVVDEAPVVPVVDGAVIAGGAAALPLRTIASVAGSWPASAAAGAEMRMLTTVADGAGGFSG